MDSQRSETVSHRALITGGSRGIGLAIAQALAGRGDGVVLVARSRDALATAVASMRTEGADAHYLCADVGTAARAERLADRAFKRFPDIDTLILNAGLARHRLFSDSSSSDLLEEFNTNYFAPAALAKSFATARAGRPGRIVVIGSLTAEFPFPGHANYAASKAASVQLFRSLQLEWAKTSLTISIVLPGLTQTDIVQDLKTVLPLASVRSVATAVLECLDQGTPEVVPGWDNRLALRFSRFFPGVFQNILNRSADALIPGFAQLNRQQS